MDMATIGAAITGLRFAKDTLQTMLNLKVEAETQATITDALSRLAATQEAVFGMREELFRLQAQNEQLRQDLKVRDDWNARAARYSLKEAAGGAIVWESTFTPRHFACPPCFEKCSIQVLQDQNVSTGLFFCPSCKESFRVGAPRSISAPAGRAAGVIEFL